MPARWPPREQHSQKSEPSLTGQKRDNNVVLLGLSYNMHFCPLRPRKLSKLSIITENWGYQTPKNISNLFAE